MDPETSSKDVFVPSFQQHPTFRESTLVPLEILAEIFLFALPPINLCQARQRTTLALVCRLWNDIIEATPILWSRISTSDEPSNVKRSLLKSAECPIDVYGICTQRPADNHDRCRHFFREVKRHIERWRCVELWEACEKRPIAIAPTHAPFLESVKLRSIATDNADDGYLTLVTSACAPRLRELVLDSMEFARWDISFPPTLSRLVLQYIRISSPQILTALAASPKLTVLHLSELYAPKRNDDIPNSGIIELASLREMTFHVNSSDIIREVMARLKFSSDCKVSLACEIFDQETRASFLDPALSRYRETFQRVEEIIQVKISVPGHRVRLVLRYLHWEITLDLMNRTAIRDTLEWFGISTNENAPASHLENFPTNPTPPTSNVVPISLEFDDYSRLYDLEYLDPVFDLGCITRIELKTDAYRSILSYLANPRILIQRAAAAAAEGNHEAAENDGFAMRHVTETWLLPGVRELSLEMGGGHVLRAVMEFVQGRSSSGVGMGYDRSVLVEARFPAGLKLVEFGAKHDTSPQRERLRCRGGVEALAWPSSLPNLLEILDEDAQVFWLGNRISKEWDHGLIVDDG